MHKRATPPDEPRQPKLRTNQEAGHWNRLGDRVGFRPGTYVVRREVEIEWRERFSILCCGLRAQPRTQIGSVTTEEPGNLRMCRPLVLRKSFFVSRGLCVAQPGSTVSATSPQLYVHRVLYFFLNYIMYCWIRVGRQLGMSFSFFFTFSFFSYYSIFISCSLSIYIIFISFFYFPFYFFLFLFLLFLIHLFSFS